MKKNPITHLRAVALVALPVLFSGCATPALWKHTAARTWQPDGVPDQFLVTTTTGRQDVIVVFHQSATVRRKEEIRLAGWNLRLGETGLVHGRSAVRRLTNSCERVQPMPVYAREKVPADIASASPGYAVLERSWCQFTVHLDGAPPGPFELPVSHQKRRTFARVAGMPLAISADAVIIATVAAAMAGSGAGGANGIRAF